MNSQQESGSISEDENTIEASFALLEICLEQLTEIAPVTSPEQILQLIPDVTVSARRLILVELLKFDLASAAEAGTPRTLEFYWPMAGEILPQDAIPFDLVLEEVQLRRAAGDNPRWADYRQRFPDLADTIGKWLAGGETQGATGVPGKVPELPVGQVVDDFHVLKLLGQGAFARVYLARQQSMHRLCALKATSRGSEEPQALSQLDHANIVRVYDQREIADPPTILLYMQYLAGGTLADCVKLVRELPPAMWNGQKILDSIDQNLLDASQTAPEQSMVRQQIAEMEWAEVVAWFGIQLAEGLDYANGKGVLHRDVKPANILLSAEAIPKLADFNVSCSGLSGRAGAAAYFGGSLAYMSPEQLEVADPTKSREANDLDGRSDLYALGIVLWELWQGTRPWTLTDIASSWTEAVAMQQECRKSPFEAQRPAQSAAERVLEKVLRGLLSVDPADRPCNGKEAAARLRLAFYPELANRFEPAPTSLAGRLLSYPVLLISAVLIFGPNTAAATFNFFYNQERVHSDYCPQQLSVLSSGKDMSDTNRASRERKLPQLIAGPEMSVPIPVADAASEVNAGCQAPIHAYFKWISDCVNYTVFPLGAALFLIITLPIATTVARAREGIHANSKEIARLWAIGLRATLICGVLWSVSGCVFAVGMYRNFPGLFHTADAFHFLISLVLCGGVAWIYPYFGMTLLSLLIYYPKVISPSMSDPDFAARSQRLRRQNSLYLISAAAIPLIAIGALVAREDIPKELVIAGVCITAIGLSFAYFAHQRIDETLRQYDRVLGDRKKDRVSI